MMMPTSIGLLLESAVSESALCESVGTAAIGFVIASAVCFALIVGLDAVNQRVCLWPIVDLLSMLACHSDPDCIKSR